ncbi:MAG: competence protein CoiA family protein [Mobilitalea sp.]
MENCIHNGKEICTFDLKDKSGYYIDDLVLEWKIAADKGKLICSDCGQRVYLAAGPIKEPYFAHYDKEACSYGNQKESEESKKGKRLLYSLLRDSFPQADIKARCRMKNGMYSTCYVSTSGSQDIAVDYRLQQTGIDNFTERDLYYKENEIIPLYILGINKNIDTNQISWYADLIQKSIGMCLYLDTRNETILLKKRFDYRIGAQRKIKYCKKTYPIQELVLKPDGSFVCDFYEECHKIEQEIQQSKNDYDQKLREKRSQNKAMEIWLNANRTEIRPDILQNAIECLKRGEGELVSKKYLDYIKENNLF